VGRPIRREDWPVIYRGHSQQYMTSLFTILLIGIRQSVVKSPVPCGYMRIVLYVILVYLYVKFIEGRCQSMLYTADRALTHVANVTTAT
jgi:hypothetical protein